MSFTPLANFKDRHSGKRALIFGCGPSLNNFDFSKIKPDDVTFAVNRSVALMKHCDYFCLCDGCVTISNYFQHGCKIADNIMFCSSGFDETFLGGEATSEKSCFFNRRCDGIRNLNFNSDDGLLVEGNDIVQVSAHLAHIMGCDPIVMIGVDLRYIKGVKYCNGTELGCDIDEPMPEGVKQMIAASTTLDPMLITSLGVWTRIKDQNRDINFLNATPDGKLGELFPTVEI